MFPSQDGPFVTDLYGHYGRARDLCIGKTGIFALGISTQIDVEWIPTDTSSWK